MDTVVLSSKNQIAIPKRIREMLGLRPGHEFQVIAHEHRIELIPVRSARELRGFLRGMSDDFEREPDRL
jgi:AbrB family looped-hinge helix DNA binding protein